MPLDACALPPPAAHVASYYAATTNPAPVRSALSRRHRAEICVVGAGYTGLSAALDLAEAGRDVVVLEAARVGWGASGRNGGQIVNGLNAGLDTIGRRHGADTQAFFGTLIHEGGDIIRDRVARYGIACDLKAGNLFAALTSRHMRDLEAKAVLWDRLGLGGLELVDRDGIRAHVGSDAYAGGMIDRRGGHFHALNLALGEAEALEGLGGRIHEGSAVLEVDTDGDLPCIRTAVAEIVCDHLILAGNAYLGRTVPALAPRVLPVSTQVMATEPLPEAIARTLLPTDLAVEDARYILDYYRLTADWRLLFGGGVVYGGGEPSDVIAKLRPNMLRVFPQLCGVEIAYAWSGNFALSFSRLPQIGRLGPRTWFAHGYSGHGVAGSHLFGRIIAEAIVGDTSRFDRLAALPWISFPGRRTFGAAYCTLGSWFYAMGDRLGV